MQILFNQSKKNVIQYEHGLLTSQNLTFQSSLHLLKNDEDTRWHKYFLDVGWRFCWMKMIQLYENYAK